MKPTRLIAHLIILLLIVPLILTTSAQALTHPCLLFNNITETPGYQHSTESPWSDWNATIFSQANAALSYNFSDPSKRMLEQGEKAMYLGLAYQISKDTTYAEKAKEALLNMDIGSVILDIDRSRGLFGYSLCYDWVQPYLNSTEDETVRDKLATLADDVYYDLNDGGTNTEDVTFADYHAEAYSIMGITGCVLSDYTNPNNLSFNSTPSDWFKVGTDYLFVNDSLHSFNKSLVGMVFDSSGKYTAGTYKHYFQDKFMWWFQIYSHFNGSNIFDVYPISKKMMISELWDSLPNRYASDYGTLGNLKEFYHRGIVNLLDDDNRSYILNHDDIIENSNLLPYSTYNRGANTVLLYLVYDDYSTIQRKNPSWTSHFDPTSFYQVFRGSWQNDSDWLSLITWPEGLETTSNRDMAHHDQLSFEYYSRGDLLLADGGENKHVLDKYYGQYGIFHNTILIEDPRTSFGASSWSDSQARGIFKGDVYGLSTPAYIRNLINTTWIESMDANTTITKVIGSSWAYSQSLSSPIEYERSVIYPEKDYFAIIDRLEGGEPWVYRNVFRPTSLNITPTMQVSNYTDIEINASAGIYEASHTVSFDSIDGKSFEVYTRFISPNASGVMNVYVNDNYVGNISFTNESAYYSIRDISSTYLTAGTNTIKYNTTDSVILTIDFTTITNIGEVKVNLSINNTTYDWLSLPYKSETSTGITTNSIRWNTTNPYGNEVNMHLFSSPASEIRITKHVTRIAGYDTASEVFLPVIYFRSNETNDLYRVTVLLSRYPSEEEKIPEEIPVTGNGTAVKVTSSAYEDFIYTGNGTSSFGDITTDVKTLFLRKTTQPSEYTIINGSYLNYSASPLFEISNKVDYLTLNKTGENITFYIKGEGNDVDIALYQINQSITYQVKKDGVPYSWRITDGKMIITTDLSEHVFEIEQTESDSTIPSITNITVTNITSNSATITWETNESADSLVKYGTSPGSYSMQEHDYYLVTSHSITLTDLSPETTYYFVVNSTDNSGNSNESDEHSFTTLSSPTPQPDQSWTTGFHSWANNVSYDNTTLYNGFIQLLNGRIGTQMSTYDKYSSSPLDSASEKIASGFTAQTDDTITNISIYIDTITGTSPVYNIGIQKDNGGVPDGVYLGNATFQPTSTGWIDISISPSVTIEKGQGYHVVIEYYSGTIDAGNCTKVAGIRQGAFLNDLQPYPLEGDTNLVFDDPLYLNQFYDGTSWSTASSLWINPIMMLHGEYKEGNVFDSLGLVSIGYYGVNSNTVNQTVSTKTVDKYVNSLSIDVYAVTGSPEITTTIFDSLDNPLWSNTSTPVAGINTYTIDPPIKLEVGETYKLSINCSANGDSGNYSRYKMSVFEYPEISWDGTDSLIEGHSDEDLQFYMDLTPVTIGNISSIIKDAESIGSNGSIWKYIKYNGTTTSDTSVAIYVNTSSDNITWSGWTLVNSSAISDTYYTLPSSNQQRYGRWRLVLTTTDTSETPVIRSVTFSTDQVPTPTHRHPYISRPFTIAGGSAALVAIAMWLYRRRRRRLRRGFYGILILFKRR